MKMKMQELMFVMSESFLYVILSIASILAPCSTHSSISTHTNIIASASDDQLKLYQDYSQVLASISALLICLSSVLSCVTLLIPILKAIRIVGGTGNGSGHGSIGSAKTHNHTRTYSASTSVDSDSRVYIAVPKDNLGIAFGSIILPLLFYNALRYFNTNDVYTPTHMDEYLLGDDSMTSVANLRLVNSMQQVQMQIYSVLIAAAGASFAISSAFSFLRSTNIDTDATSSSSALSTTPSSHLKFKRQADILQCMNKTYPIMLAIIIGCCSRTRARTFQHGTENERNIYYPIIQRDPWPIAIFTVFATVQFLLLQCYMFSYSTNTNMNAPQYNKPLDARRPIGSAFTMGEWIGVTAFLSVLSTQYIHTNLLQTIFTVSFLGHVSDIDSIGSTILSSVVIQRVPSEWIVAQAGFLGCLIGATLPLNQVHSVLQVIVARIKCVWLQRKMQVRSVKIRCLMRLFVVALTTFIALEYALVVYCGNRNGNDNGRQGGWESEGCTCAEDDFCLGPLKSIVWLVWFLRQSGNRGRNAQGGHMPVHIREGFSYMSYIMALPHYAWLMYWIITVVFLAPLAILIAKKLQCLRNGSARKRQLIVMARKYFHFVAVVLFLPPTFYAPEMMVLSYAIAAALLILVESIRGALSWEGRGGSETRGDGSYVKTKEASSLTTNQFFETFFDVKDLCAVEGSFVVTHLALILGCAMPLWMHQVMIYGSASTSMTKQDSNNDGIDCLVPFLGIIVLGIGDAAGALCGSMFGKRLWPTSKRTVEGSTAMLSSMIVSDVLIREMFGFVWNMHVVCEGALYYYLPLTVLEAVTLQIDNLCLPLVALVLSSLR